MTAFMKPYTEQQLKEVLALHSLWLKTNCTEGVRANLTDASLYNVNLTNANLSYTDLTDVDLAHAILTHLMLLQLMIKENIMTIDFINKNSKINDRLSPTIKFEHIGEYYDATICLDDIPVAYFDNSTGGLCLVPFEIGPHLVDGGDAKDVDYLESRGVIFNVSERRSSGKTVYEYRIKVDE